MVNVKIKLTRTLPIDAKHGCVEGKEFTAKYKNTYVSEDGVERPSSTRGTPVEFTGIDGSPCVAFSDEYAIVVEEKSNYQSACKRIDDSTTPEAVELVESGLARVYDTGHLTTSEFSRLSDRIMERYFELTEERDDI